MSVELRSKETTDRFEIIEETSLRTPESPSLFLEKLKKAKNSQLGRTLDRTEQDSVDTLLSCRFNWRWLRPAWKYLEKRTSWSFKEPIIRSLHLASKITLVSFDIFTEFMSLDLQKVLYELLRWKNCEVDDDFLSRRLGRARIGVLFEDFGLVRLGTDFSFIIFMIVNEEY